MPARMLGQREAGHEIVCQQEHWVLKGVDWGVPHRLEKGTSVSEDTGP